MNNVKICGTGMPLFACGHKLKSLGFNVTLDGINQRQLDEPEQLGVNLDFLGQTPSTNEENILNSIKSDLAVFGIPMRINSRAKIIN